VEELDEVAREAEPPQYVPLASRTHCAPSHEAFNVNHT
jgi:hypothetical protein